MDSIIPPSITTLSAACTGCPVWLTNSSLMIETLAVVLDATCENSETWSPTAPERPTMATPLKPKGPGGGGGGEEMLAKTSREMIPDPGGISVVESMTSAGIVSNRDVKCLTSAS